MDYCELNNEIVDIIRSAGKLKDRLDLIRREIGGEGVEIKSTLTESEGCIIPDINKSTYNEDELRHIAVNYAITCLKGYEGSFDNWFNRVGADWRKIANRK